MERKALGSSWNKYYCHYQKDGRYESTRTTFPFPQIVIILKNHF